jgi:hypothetical protein
MPRKVIECFAVPPDAHGINPFELPISVRLARLLGAKKITRLGDVREN